MVSFTEILNRNYDITQKHSNGRRRFKTHVLNIALHVFNSSYDSSQRDSKGKRGFETHFLSVISIVILDRKILKEDVRLRLFS